ncbi:uncharacterized protein LOC143922874 [Arctopsyche grandis]|uniref:uncharacterized protein LOC143922874 n=1 Tax=Arctopsyche grandis TaxID=121162 RepID=UPI00406D7815
MGGLLGRSKNEEGGKSLFGYRMCPGGSKKQKNKNLDTSTVSNTDKSSPTKKTSDWTEVQLQVPESLLEIENQIIKNPPVPPPRKHKSKTNTLEKQHVKLVANANTADKTFTNNYEDRIPVEEPIIVPRKEPVHICDGTHHHVTNIVNGKVIHNHCINVTKAVTKSEVEKIPPARPKFLSTVSLPDIDELKQNQEKNIAKTTKNEFTKVPQRQISVISLPTDSKITLSDTTAARLENYLRRCKNFSGLPPKQLLEQLQLNGHNSDSDDSWDGLNDWGLDITEHHGMPLKSPVQPRYTLNSPSLLRTQIKPKESSTTVPIVEENDEVGYMRNIAERRESIDDFFDSKAESIYSVPKSTEVQFNTQLGRRGSDSFFQNDKEFYPGISDNISSLKSNIFYTNALLESESQHFDKPAPVKQSVSEMKVHPASLPIVSKPEEKNHAAEKQLIQSTISKPEEKNHSAEKQIIQSTISKPEETKHATERQPIQSVMDAIDKSVIGTSKGLDFSAHNDLLETFQQFYDAHDKLADKNKKDIPNTALPVDANSNSSHLSSPECKPKRKSGNVQHSNLLKIIQENTTSEKDSDDSDKESNSHTNKIESEIKK